MKGRSKSTLRDFLLVATGAFCLWSVNAEEGFYIGVALGAGDLDIEKNSFPNANFIIDDLSGDVIVGEFSSGYRFDNNLTIDFSYEGYDSFDLFLLGDSVELTTVRVGGGYHFPGEGRLSGFIKAGVSFWDLQFTESILFNPGPEESASSDGNDLYLQFGADLKIFKGLSSRVTFDISNTAFGGSRAVKLWFGWTF